MADNFSSRGPASYSTVDLTDSEECAYWVERLQVSERILEEAIVMMGPDVAGVVAYVRAIAKKP